MEYICNSDLMLIGFLINNQFFIFDVEDGMGTRAFYVGWGCTGCTILYTSKSTLIPSAR